MKVKIFLFLYLITIFHLFPKEMMIHTFKAHNFRIELATHWELHKSFDNHKRKPILSASSIEDRIHLEIYVFPRKEKNIKLGFIQTLKNLHLRSENYYNLEQKEELPLYDLEGYWAKTIGYRQNKKILGYLIYASDGVNLFCIHAYTNASLFQKKIKTIKELFNGFSINRNFKNECCSECVNLSLEQSNSAFFNCVDFSETEECMIYFQNKPHTINQCK